MIVAAELLDEAARMLTSEKLLNEAILRRAVSTAYYGLFHTYVDLGTEIVAGDDAALSAQVARAFNHSTLRMVCDRIWKGRSGRFEPPFDRLFTEAPPVELSTIALNTLEVQGARIIADYDLRQSFTETYAVERVHLARVSAAQFTKMRHSPHARTFLVSFLLADRWTRRG